MSSKEAILAKIRANKASKKEEIEALNITDFVINDGDPYENFKANLINNKSVVYETDVSGLQSKVEEIIKNIGSKRVMFGTNLALDTSKFEAQKLVYDKSVNEIYNELFEADTSIIEAKLGISNLGVLCFVSAKEQPRLLSLLPTHCIVLMKKDALVESLDKAFEAVTKDGLPTNIIFIIGPSRTADIELQAVLGVHGPQNLHVVLY